jgi:hypothetical protein
MIDNQTKARILALLYPVQFEEQPVQGIDRVIRMVVNREALQSSETDYVKAITSALDSTDTLSTILPSRHDEETVRNYLRALKEKLQSNK